MVHWILIWCLWVEKAVEHVWSYWSTGIQAPTWTGAYSCLPVVQTRTGWQRRGASIYAVESKGAAAKAADWEQIPLRGPLLDLQGKMFASNEPKPKQKLLPREDTYRKHPRRHFDCILPVK